MIDRCVPSYYHPGKAARIKIGKNIIGFFGEIHPLTKLGIKQPVCSFELFTDDLPSTKHKSVKKAYRQNNLPLVKRDYCFVIDQEQPAAKLLDIVRKSSNVIEEVTIFDCYENLENEKKSIALRVSLQPQDKTLTESEINLISEKIISTAENELNARLRS